MPKGAKVLLIVVVLLLVLGVVADRVTASVAQSQLAKRIQTELSLASEPEVHAHGIPFLTQLFGGKYTDIEVSAQDVTVEQLSGLDVHADLRGVHVPFSSLTSGDVDKVPVDLVQGTVAMPYDRILAAVNLPKLQLSQASNGGLTIRGDVTVAGRTFTASATANLALAGSTVLINAQNVTVQGVDVPSALRPLLATALSFKVPVPTLPLGLKLTAVTPGPTALNVAAEAHDTVLSKDAVSR